MNDNRPRTLSLKEDWAAVPYLVIISSGFIVALYDFVKLQDMSFQLNCLNLSGIPLLLLGGVMRIKSRRALMKAGLGLLSSSRLKITEDQRLVTKGIYEHIRHPLYLGEITRNFGLCLILSSLYGFLLMALGNLFLIIRIKIEERMLVEKFGLEYEEYQKKTKKLIPYIY